MGDSPILYSNRDPYQAQDGGTRRATFHGELDLCREIKGWTKACSSSMLEREGKNQGQDSPKQASSCWFARHS